MKVTNNILINKLKVLKLRAKKWQLRIEDLSEQQLIVFLAGVTFLKKKDLELSLNRAESLISEREKLNRRLVSQFDTWKDSI